MEGVGSNYRFTTHIHFCSCTRVYGNNCGAMMRVCVGECFCLYFFFFVSSRLCGIVMGDLVRGEYGMRVFGM